MSLRGASMVEFGEPGAGRCTLLTCGSMVLSPGDSRPLPARNRKTTSSGAPPTKPPTHPPLDTIVHAERCGSFEECIAWARRKFQQQFYDRIAQVGAKAGKGHQAGHLQSLFAPSIRAAGHRSLVRPDICRSRCCSRQAGLQLRLLLPPAAWDDLFFFFVFFFLSFFPVPHAAAGVHLP